MWKPGCNFDYIVGTCVHMGLKFSAQFSLSPCCASCLFWDCSDPCSGEPRTLLRLTTLQSFCKIIRHCALNLELLYGSTLIESNSYHYHHHNGHEICFVLLCNTCSWSEIIELVRFKLKECYIKFSLRHCHKISSHDAPFRRGSFYMQTKKKQGRSLLKTYSFRCKKKVFMLYSENIRYQDHYLIIYNLSYII